MTTNSQPVIPDHPKTKLVYIDHIKVMLTALVVMHHACVTYGAPGGWYYSEKSALLVPQLLMTIFVSVNQSFFMGFFFFLSALFIPASYDKKGPAKFLADRLLRLGVPLVFYSFVLSPFLSYLPYYFAEGKHITYAQYLSGFDGWINFGVLWFVAALLLFTVIYALYRMIAGKALQGVTAPKAKQIWWFAAGIGLVSFFVRIVFPVGWTLKPLGFQLGHFPQYIALFILGLVAARNQWLHQLTVGMGLQMRRLALWLVIIMFPLFFIARSLFKFPIEQFSAGAHWPQLWYALWEQLVGFSIATAFLCIGRAKWNKFLPLFSGLARSTFAVYIFHPLVLISLSMLFKPWAVDPALKCIVVAPLGVLLSFIVGSAIVRIPGINRIV
jgi:surface polysaccharide O-acyltransferase-like enzyme